MSGAHGNEAGGRRSGATMARVTKVDQLPVTAAMMNTIIDTMVAVCDLRRLTENADDPETRDIAQRALGINADQLKQMEAHQEPILSAYEAAIKMALYNIPSRAIFHDLETDSLPAEIKPHSPETIADLKTALTKSTEYAAIGICAIEGLDPQTKEGAIETYRIVNNALYEQAVMIAQRPTVSSVSKR